MNIIVDITAFGYEPGIGFDLNDLVESIEDPIEDEYDIRCTVNPKTVILGQHDPARVVAVAKGWNRSIRKAFVDSLRNLTDEDLVAAEHGGADADALVDAIPLDDQRTFAVSLAARAIDNHWHLFGEYGVYLPNDSGYPYWHVTLTDKALKDVVEHPEKYAIGYMVVT